jgi:alpha-L-rhamnosidase
MVKVLPATFEHHRESLGIGEPTPRISWRFVGDDPNWIQASYDIEILRPLVDPVIPEVFHVESRDSVLVPWPTTTLLPRESASVRVRATGRDGVATSWSEPSTVETGLFSREHWTAKFIATTRTSAPNGALRPVLFRKPFKLANKVRKARLYITAQGIYEAHINGTRVGDHVLAPGWTSYNHRLSYQTFDITQLLVEGENAIGVEIGEGWFCTRLGFDGGRRNIYGDRVALLAQIEILLEDGNSFTINSDSTWRAGTGPIISSEIYDGEIYDATLEIKGWSLPTFSDEQWTSVEETSFPTAKLLAPTGPPVRRLENLSPQNIFKSPTGKVIVDFGQNLVGWLRVRVSGPKGHTITFIHTEVLENGECATRPLRDCKATDSITLSNELLQWEPKFTFHGFRYVQVDSWPSETGEPAPGEIEAVVVHTDMEQTGWFECSEPMVNRLHENIRWGMKGNFVSIPTDCPQRDERLGWTGDIQIFAPTANFLYDTSGMLSGWLQDLAVEQLNDYSGEVPLVCPNIIGPSFSKTQAAWSDAVVITPNDLYQSFGDRQILLEQYRSMTTWLEIGLPRGPNGLWNPSTDQLGDWLDPDAPPSNPGKAKTDPHFVANAYLIRVTKLLAQTSEILGLHDDYSRFTAEATKLVRVFQNEYLTLSGRLAPDTMTSLSLAITYSLFRTPEETVAAAERLALLVRRSKFKIGTGFVGTPLICPVLSQTGFSQLAYSMLLCKQCPSWLYPITMGATTMWERWDSMLPDGSVNPGSMTSFNHYALGSVGAWLHSTVAGISLAEPGWRKICFEPVPGGTITSAKAVFESPYGRVENSWRIEDGKFIMKAIVPPNTTAVIKLPGQGSKTEVGSGTHDFNIPYKALECPPTAIIDLFAPDG